MQNTETMSKKLPERWYIKGSPELEVYFKSIDEILVGDNEYDGYFIEGNDWDCEELNRLDKSAEITLSDYLASLTPEQP